MSDMYPIVYAVKHKENAVVEKSRSGGIFTAVSDYILDKHGAVYGAVMATVYHAEHIRAVDRTTRDLMRGSKYIQSSLKESFHQIREDLDNGLWVLFSGTPCQVSGLKHFLRKDYEKLICMDILCHGVPSPKVWKAYLKWQEKNHKKKATVVDFRDKSTVGWRNHIESITFEDEKISSKIYSNIFYKHETLRESCYCCPYKTTRRTGDISIGDYWYIEKAAPEYDDNKGVSLVLINTPKGQMVFESIQNDIKFTQTRLEDSMQDALVKPYPSPATRETFWNDFQHRSFRYIACKYGGYGFRNKYITPYFRKICRKLGRRKE